MKRIKKIGLLVVLWAFMAPAQAAMVATPDIAAESPATQLPLSPVQRQFTVRQLVDRGVDAANAELRVAQMTDQQVLLLQSEIDQLPAGGISTTNLLLIIILIVLLI